MLDRRSVAVTAMKLSLIAILPSTVHLVLEQAFIEQASLTSYADSRLVLGLK